MPRINFEDKEEFRRKINENVMRLRREKGLSQVDFGAILGISRTAITGFEANRKFYNLGHLYCLCIYFGCSIYDLIPDIINNHEEGQ